MSFEIKIPLFEGPFDLLLFFIERDELDIHDIPIAQITRDFLDYIHQLERMNIEVASEFILVTATLMRIKAKMLLPRTIVDEEGNEIDPREELVKHLLEYKKYKSVVKEMAAMEEERGKKFPRGNLVQELKSIASGQEVEMELQHIDLYRLLKVYQRVSLRYIQKQESHTHEVVQYQYTIAEQKLFIEKMLAQQDKVAFSEIIQTNPDKIFIIFNFLAILELLNVRKIHLVIGEGFNNFWITHPPAEEAA